MRKGPCPRGRCGRLGEGLFGGVSVELCRGRGGCG